jgi:hypothetical protein
MSQRLTVANIMADTTFVSGDLGLCLPAQRSKFLSYLNGAEEEMQNYGRWWGSITEAQFCIRKGCVVFPREVATIEQIAICGQPMTIENSWYQWTQNLATIASCGGSCSSDTCNTNISGVCGCGHLGMRMQARFAASFDWTVGENKALRFYPTHSSDVGKKIVVQGYDENNIWVRTSFDGSVQDGEQVTLALPYVDTTTVWYPGAPSAIQKEATSYRVLLYEVNTSTGDERALGVYQPSETNPEYRVATIPGFRYIKCGGCCDADSSNPPRTITALVKLHHIPLSADRDWLLFRNLQAYRYAMLSQFHRRNGNFDLANAFMFGTPAPRQSRMSNQATLSKGGAIPLLRAELRSMTGDNTTAYVHREATNSFPYMMNGFQ